MRCRLPKCIRSQKCLKRSMAPLSWSPRPLLPHSSFLPRTPGAPKGRGEPRYLLQLQTLTVAYTLTVVQNAAQLQEYCGKLVQAFIPRLAKGR